MITLTGPILCELEGAFDAGYFLHDFFDQRRLALQQRFPRSGRPFATHHGSRPFDDYYFVQIPDRNFSGSPGSSRRAQRDRLHGL